MTYREMLADSRFHYGETRQLLDEAVRFSDAKSRGPWSWNKLLPRRDRAFPTGSTQA